MSNSTRNNVNSGIIKMVMTAMISAIVIAMSFIPYVGYIRYSPLSLEITTLHIVVIIGAIILGPWRGAIIGGVWGITSLIYAVVYPSVASPAFLNPLVSVFPRIVVGLIAGLCFRGMMKLFSDDFVPSAIIAATAGTLTNTTLVLTFYFLFSNVFNVGEILTNIIGTIIGVNGVIEIVAAIVLIPALGYPLFKYVRKHGGV